MSHGLRLLLHISPLHPHVSAVEAPKAFRHK